MPLLKYHNRLDNRRENLYSSGVCSLYKRVTRDCACVIGPDIYLLQTEYQSYFRHVCIEP